MQVYIRDIKATVNKLAQEILNGGYIFMCDEDKRPAIVSIYVSMRVRDIRAVSAPLNKNVGQTISVDGKEAVILWVADNTG